MGTDNERFLVAQQVEVIGQEYNCKDTLHYTINAEINFKISFKSDSCLLPVTLSMSDTTLIYWLEDQEIRHNFIINRQGNILIEARLNGCSKQEIIKIPICDLNPLYHMPSAFSPNKDGLNERFKPWTKYGLDFTLQIYNRWGEKIYEGSQNGKGWDGTYRGEDVSSGTYIYVVEMQFLNGQKNRVSGTVSIIR